MAWKGRNAREEAAIRELWEEVGLKDAALGPCIWHGTHTGTSMDGLPQVTVGTYFICRVDAHEPGEHLNLDEIEREVVTDRRWWTLDEIEASAETFLPTNLAALLMPILRGDLPAEPVKVDW